MVSDTLHRRDVIAGLVGMAVAGAAGAGPPPLESYDDPDRIYDTLERQPATVLPTPGGMIRLAFADGAPGLDRAAVEAWVRRAADAVTAYYGQFPVAQYDLLIVATDGADVGHATTWGYRGAMTRIQVDRQAERAVFDADWRLVHEMVHTGFPNLPRRALWLQEGNATWIEPIARAMTGWLSPAEIWREAAVGMERGRPAATAGGMDGTRDWGRVYWGGATFWLSAEIAIADQTAGRASLRQAMRAVNRASGGIVVEWEPERVMSVGDEATKSNALTTLYRLFAMRRQNPNLDAIFRRLGVVDASRTGVTLDDAAPAAALRRTITAK